MALVGVEVELGRGVHVCVCEVSPESTFKVIPDDSAIKVLV